MFLPTLREVPADAEVASHRLLLRGGFVRKLAAGVYSYLPLGRRVHEKIAQIVREEMDRIGGLECFLPVLVPKELLDETGRSGIDILFPLKDRNDRDFYLGFTHEETITEIVRAYVSSWKQLPLILYQIQTKFRDEPRPRAGLLRGREFTMKDAYSFDSDQSGLDKAFDAHRDAYCRIFERCGLEYLVVNAFSGAIGGSENNEFMVLAESGEDTVLRCDSCGYAANAERAEIGNVSAEEIAERIRKLGSGGKSEVVSTPGAHTVAQVCEFLGVSPQQLIKTIIVQAGDTVLAALVRGDRELSLTKLSQALGRPAELADPATILRVTGAPVGFAGPVDLKDVDILGDRELAGTTSMVVGANVNDAHRTGVTPGIDFQATSWLDIRVPVAGDPCGQAGCQGRYTDAHGIEVGHIFKLGTKYSQAMGAQVQMPTGENIDIIMGCYGLGISRTMASAVEAHHDDDGILWPISIAPYEVVIVVVNLSDEAQKMAGEELHDSLTARGIEAVLDERDERSGVKFKDADLIGYPIKVVIGRALAEGKVEIGLRRDKAGTQQVSVNESADYVARLVDAEKSRLS